LRPLWPYYKVHNSCSCVNTYLPVYCRISGARIQQEPTLNLKLVPTNVIPLPPCRGDFLSGATSNETESASVEERVELISLIFLLIA